MRISRSISSEVDVPIDHRVAGDRRRMGAPGDWDPVEVGGKEGNYKVFEQSDRRRLQSGGSAPAPSGSWNTVIGGKYDSDGIELFSAYSNEGTSSFSVGDLYDNMMDNRPSFSGPLLFDFPTKTMITQYTLWPQIPHTSCYHWFHSMRVWDFEGWDEDAQRWVMVDRQPYESEASSGKMTCLVTGDGTPGTGECNNGDMFVDGGSRCDQGYPGAANNRCPFCPQNQSPQGVQFNTAAPAFYHQYKLTTYAVYGSGTGCAAPACRSRSYRGTYLSEIDFEYGFATADWWVTHCMGDMDGDGDVDTMDLLEMLAAFGLQHASLLADLNADGRVDVPDLLILLAAFGNCVIPGCDATAVCAESNQNVHMATTSASRNVFDPGSDAWSNADPAYPATYTVNGNTAYFQTKPALGDLPYCSFPPVGAEDAALTYLQDTIRDSGIASLEYDLALASLAELRDPRNVHGCKGFISYEPHFTCRCTWALSVYIRGVRDSPQTLKDFEVFTADSLAGPWERLFAGTMPNSRAVRTLDFSGGSGGSNQCDNQCASEYVYTKGDFTFTSDNAARGTNQNYHMGYLFDGKATPDQHTTYWLGQNNRDTKFTFDFGVQLFIEKFRIAPRVRGGWQCPDFQVFSEAGFRAAGPNEPSCVSVAGSCNSLTFQSQEPAQFDDEITAVNSQLPSGNAARSFSAWVRPDCSGPWGAQRMNLFGYGDLTAPTDDSEAPTRFQVGVTCADRETAARAAVNLLDLPSTGHAFSNTNGGVPVGTNDAKGRLSQDNYWRPGNANDNQDQWMQLSLPHPHWVTGVAIAPRGNGNDNYMVTTFKVSYKLNDGDEWTYLSCGNYQECIFTDPFYPLTSSDPASWGMILKNNNQPVRAMFETGPVLASVIRINPQTWGDPTGSNGHIGMRAGLLIADADSQLFLATSTGRKSTRQDLEWPIDAAFDGAWTHLAVSIEDNGDTTMYSNGVSRGVQALDMTALNTAAVNAANPLYIGGPAQMTDWSTMMNITASAAAAAAAVAAAAAAAAAADPCAGTAVDFLNGGSISSHQGGGQYVDNMNCAWNLVCSSGTPTLSFSTFNTEANYDFLRVDTTGDGNTDTDLHGTTVPPPQIGVGTTMYVAWTTDGSVIQDGFDATFYCDGGFDTADDDPIVDFAGDLHSLKFWSRPLTADEVNTDYDTCVSSLREAPWSSSMVGWYGVDSADTFIDRTASTASVDINRPHTSISQTAVCPCKNSPDCRTVRKHTSNLFATARFPGMLLSDCL